MVRSQAFVRGLDSRTRCLQFDGEQVPGAQLRCAVAAATGLPLPEMRLITGKREVTDSCVLRAGADGLLPSLTVLLRLCGGKGGFGSLLRGAGKASKQTTNYDSCRDLDGRRLRHVNAEKKIHEWKTLAEDRELEEIAKKHIKELERQEKKKQEEKLLAEAAAIRVESTHIAETLVDSVAKGLTESERLLVHHAAAKRKAEEDAALANAKKRKCMWLLEGEGEDFSDDEEDGAQKAGPSTARPAASIIPPASNGAAKGKEPDAEPPKANGAAAAAAAAASRAAPAEPTGRGPAPAAAAAQAPAAQASAPALTPAQAQAAAAPAGQIDLSKFSSAGDLEPLGLDRLKAELQARGLKCGGALGERAARLFLLRDTPLEKVDKKHLAPPQKK